MDAHLDLSHAEDGLVVETGFAGTPCEGVLFRRTITLPAFERACFYNGECWRVEEAAGWGWWAVRTSCSGPPRSRQSNGGAERLALDLVEGGPVTVFSETVPACDDAAVEPLGNGFWRLALPVGPGPARVVLSRPVR